MISIKDLSPEQQKNFLIASIVVAALCVGLLFFPRVKQVIISLTEATKLKSEAVNILPDLVQRNGSR